MSTLTTPSKSQMLLFQAWRATALQIMPYMASTLFALRPVNTQEVDTFAIDDGLRVYVNFDKCEPMGAQFCAEGLLHECSHILAEHSMLAEVAGVTDEERRMWNIAGDMAINDDLRDAGCSALAAHGVFAAQIGQPDYQTPLTYMEVLRRKTAAQQKKQQQNGQGQPGKNGQPTDDSGAPMKGCGSGSGSVAGGFELGDDDMKGKAPAASSAEKAMVRISTAASVRQHQEQHGIGSVPGGIAQIVDEILAPSVTPWERVLASFIRRAVAHKLGQHDTTYARRHRRRMNETLRNRQGGIVGRVIAPGYIKPVPSVHFYRDTSGSVDDHSLAVATNEVLAIAKKLGIRGDDLLVSDIDTQVHQTQKFAGLASVTDVQGRGGTEMGEAIVHACNLKNKPSVIVIATDGETYWPTERPSVPVVVLLVNLRSDYWRENVPSWAHVVEVKNND
ncbi:DUF2201 family putative metallopeptidase [Arthrobacter caoxuetaonis]|uniref:VWA-like domain-containing protein n=1 Tax=Arthrobacter caoxuetaonis TaxID=2886935 RepID=A0A9X1SEM4_9MICC|nr:VWA-like domain-containing protein [Arthrobacter caoxuetaonis]MCC3299816.1 VWA-like domain-containing protein [Arthrobacter caoxuetaonis]USQ59284.1 VWA-like domain-containing protein [Arthrobacter caoxuetaonis]